MYVCRREELDNQDMKHMASLLGVEDGFEEIPIADVKKMVRKEKRHLASISACSELNRYLLNVKSTALAVSLLPFDLG